MNVFSRLIMIRRRLMLALFAPGTSNRAQISESGPLAARLARASAASCRAGSMGKIRYPADDSPAASKECYCTKTSTPGCVAASPKRN